MSLCPDLALVKLAPHEVECKRLHCRSFYCEHCAPHRRRQLFAEACAGHPTAFLTLTVNPQTGTDPDDRACKLVDAFQALIREARRRHPGQEIEYLAVFEKTKRCEPHLHVLLRGPYLDQRWISDFMAARTEAPVCWIRKVKPRDRDAGYVAKYVSKDPTPFLGTKRYWSSRGYDLEPWTRPENDPAVLVDWTRTPLPIDRTRFHLAVRGFDMQLVGPCHWRGSDDPGGLYDYDYRGLSP